MGLFDDILDLGVNIIKTPINIAKDGLDIVQGEEPNNTVDGLEDIADNVDDIIDDLFD